MMPRILIQFLISEDAACGGLGSIASALSLSLVCCLSIVLLQ